MSRLPVRVVRHVRERARGRCKYCLSQECLVGDEFTVDHIIPRSEGGSDDMDNLALACHVCNEHKHSKTSAIDPDTQEHIHLFNPRDDSWADHFRWSDDSSQVLGITPMGRATVAALQLNRRGRVQGRKLWAQYGVHPPSTEPPKNRTTE